MHCFVSKQAISLYTTFIGRDSEGYSGKSLQASIMWMGKKASQPQPHFKRARQPYRPFPFSFLFFRMGTSWPDFLSLSIQIGHDSRECHKARLYSHESASCHCIVHWFSLLFLGDRINRWRSTWARPQYVRSQFRDVLFFSVMGVERLQ